MSAIYLIRHGQASFGSADYDRLSERGTLQSRVLGATLTRLLTRETAVVCGAMQRHRQTAQACLEAMGRELQWQTDARWNEFDHEDVIRAHRPEYAEFERMRADLMATPDPRAAFQALFEVAIARWIGGAHDADYREPWSAFRARCRQGLETLIESLPPSRDAVVFTSGGPIAVLVQELTRMSDSELYGLRPVNCGITHLLRGDDGVRLSSFNNHAHFKGEHASLLTQR